MDYSELSSCLLNGYVMGLVLGSCSFLVGFTIKKLYQFLRN